MKLTDRYRQLSADHTVLLWMTVWFFVNIIQAAFTELANDEAYYLLYAEQLSWGYFDHPPVIAALIAAGRMIFGGELGVRFMTILLQPAYLYILWKLIKPADATRKDGELFSLISASTLTMQLFGFVAVPDGALMFSSAVFLLTWRNFCRETRHSWIWLGLAMALMAYSKYHGILVLGFAVLSNPKILARPKLYLAGLLTAILIAPHIIWQYNHDWITFDYHLNDRSTSFRITYLTDYLANILLIFNPLFFWHFLKGIFVKNERNGEAVMAIRYISCGFILFFLASSFRGYIHPQWILVSSFGFILAVFDTARKNLTSRKYIMRAGTVTVAVIAAARILLIANPSFMKFETFNNRASYSTIAEKADGRPVVFRGNYSIAAKYMFYTGEEAYCQPNIFYRSHQWQLRDDDSRFIGKPAMIEYCPQTDKEGMIETESILLQNGMTFRYFNEDSYIQLRKIQIECGSIPEEIHGGEEISFGLTVSNPYDYTVEIDGSETKLMSVWRVGSFSRIESYDTGTVMTLSPGEKKHIIVSFTVPEDLAGAEYNCGFTVIRRGHASWFNGNPQKVKVI